MKDFELRNDKSSVRVGAIFVGVLGLVLAGFLIGTVAYNNPPPLPVGIGMSVLAALFLFLAVKGWISTLKTVVHSRATDKGVYDYSQGQEIFVPWGSISKISLVGPDENESLRLDFSRFRPFRKKGTNEVKQLKFLVYPLRGTEYVPNRVYDEYFTRWEAHKAMEVQREQERREREANFPESNYALLAQIGDLLSAGNKEVLARLNACTADHLAFMRQHEKFYSDWALDESRPKRQVCWYALVQAMEPEGHLWLVDVDDNVTDTQAFQKVNAMLAARDEDPVDFSALEGQDLAAIDLWDAIDKTLQAEGWRFLYMTGISDNFAFCVVASSEAQWADEMAQKFGFNIYAGY